MACTTMRREGQGFAERAKEVADALARLRRYIAAGQVQIVLGPTGAVTLQGWKDRADISDTCAVRSLSAEGAPELRAALAAAERKAGRKANVQAIAAGHHSHDGGKTWHGGHR